MPGTQKSGGFSNARYWPSVYKLYETAGNEVFTMFIKAESPLRAKYAYAKWIVRTASGGYFASIPLNKRVGYAYLEVGLDTAPVYLSSVKEFKKSL
mgnify:FL=1